MMLKLLAAAVLCAGMLWPQTPPKQPIEFSHKLHATAGVTCHDCHRNPDPGEAMGIPAAAQCLNCHRAIAQDKPEIQKLKAFAASKTAIPWARIYELPGYVSFSHRVHTEAGAKCDACHGPVADRAALWKEGNVSMGACMDCHRRNQASIDCKLCHEPR